MKWFKHECTAHCDPRIRGLVRRRGLEGVAIYWMLVEEMARLSEHVNMRLVKTESDMFGCTDMPVAVVDNLAPLVLTTPRDLVNTVEFCADVELFNGLKWRTARVIEHPNGLMISDTYTRISRNRRAMAEKMDACSNTVRTLLEHSANKG